MPAGEIKSSTKLGSIPMTTHLEVYTTGHVNLLPLYLKCLSQPIRKLSFFISNRMSHDLALRNKSLDIDHVNQRNSCAEFNFRHGGNFDCSTKNWKRGANSREGKGHVLLSPSQRQHWNSPPRCMLFKSIGLSEPASRWAKGRQAGKV